MIENTFQIAKGVSASKERQIWASGILDWSEFMDSDSVCGMKDTKKRSCDLLYEEAYDMLRERDGQ